MTALTPRVAILLSTYNGAHYLPAQLESLLAQSVGDWVLYWRDDGSEDASVAVMEAFAAGKGAGRCIRSDIKGRLGATQSFMALLREAAPTGLPAAFADQDDVWLPEKLERALAALSGASCPTLYCSRQLLVDETLTPLRISAALRRPPSFASALAQNIATGCTVVLNPTAVSLIAGSSAPHASLHDWWSYLVVTACGGRVIADPEPTVWYRQHGHNLVGAPRSAMQRARGALRRGPGVFMAVLRLHVTALLAQPQLLTEESASLLRMVDRGLARGWPIRLRTLLAARLYRQTWGEHALFCCWFIIG